MGNFIGTINQLKECGYAKYNKTELTDYLKGYINRLKEERQDTEDLVTYNKREFCINYARLVIYKLNNLPFDKQGWDVYNEAKRNLINLGSDEIVAGNVLNTQLTNDYIREFLDIARENVAYVKEINQ